MVRRGDVMWLLLAGTMTKMGMRKRSPILESFVLQDRIEVCVKCTLLMMLRIQGYNLKLEGLEDVMIYG